MATRDDCIKAVMGGLSEFVSADVEALFNQASTAVDELVDLPGALITAERFDEDCHSCEQPIRDHLVDGRCPTVMLAAGHTVAVFERQIVGRCCDNGMFGDDHECQKQEASTDA